MATLQLDHITKRYGAVPAVDALDLAVADGELLAVVGPSGCGKTTVLRAVAGLESIDSGSIRIGDRDVTGVDAGDRNVAMVFQNHALFPHLTVAENIGFGLRARRTATDEVNRAVAEAAAVVGCTDLLRRRPDQISGGERQRVALARGLVRRPDVFLLDEPLSNLDAQLRTQMRRELRRLHQEVGGTMIYVTHDQVEALTLGDRVAVLSGGTLQQVASPAEVYRRPANRFVATFIGSPAMNVVVGELDGDILRAGPLSVRLPPGTDRRSLVDTRLEVGVRPEHLSLVSPHTSGSGPDGPLGRFEAEVTSVETAGNETFVQVRSGGDEFMVRGDSETDVAVGERVTVALAEDRIHLFEASTGTALR